MGYFDCSREPKSDIAFADMRSFYGTWIVSFKDLALCDE